MRIPPRRLCLLPWLAFVPALALASPSNGPAPQAAGTPAVEPQAVAGSILDLSGRGCRMDYSVSLLAAAQGGSDGAELQVWDDGRRIATLPLSFAADGAVHNFTGAIDLAPPLGRKVPGVGVFLVSGGANLAVQDPFRGADGCVTQAIPALSGGGIAALSGLLMLAAVALLRSRRVVRAS